MISIFGYSCITPFQMSGQGQERSNKPQIKEAVEALFGVSVKAVNTTITKGKIKRVRNTMARRKDMKKA